MNHIRIVVVDKEEAYRKKIIDVLIENGYTVSGSFHDPYFIEDSLLQIPNILIMPFKGKRSTNLKVVSQLKERYPKVKIVVSMFKKEATNSVQLKNLPVDAFYFKSKNDTETVLNIINGLFFQRYKLE